MKKTILSKVLKGVSGILILAFLLLIAPNCMAYTRNSERNYVSGALQFIPHKDFGATSISHMNEALYQWNKIGNKKYTLSRSPTERHSTTGFFAGCSSGVYSFNKDGRNYIYREFSTTFTAPGYTKFRTNVSGKVLEADICINVSRPFANGDLPDRYDTWTVFIHEAGHALGLDHPANNAYAVMNVYAPGTILRYPQTDDKNGINAIYA